MFFIFSLFIFLAPVYSLILFVDNMNLTDVVSCLEEASTRGQKQNLRNEPGATLVAFALHRLSLTGSK